MVRDNVRHGREQGRRRVGPEKRSGPRVDSFALEGFVPTSTPPASDRRSRARGASGHEGRVRIRSSFPAPERRTERAPAAAGERPCGAPRDTMGPQAPEARGRDGKGTTHGIRSDGDRRRAPRRQAAGQASFIRHPSPETGGSAWPGRIPRGRPTAVDRRVECSFASDDVVLSFGGIGATPDDHTRQCAADALEVPLTLHPEAEREMSARFGGELTPQRLRMANSPRDARSSPIPSTAFRGSRSGSIISCRGFPRWPGP